MNWYLKVVLENYLNFNGRARRTEFWMFSLFNIIATLILMAVDAVIAMVIGFSPFCFLYGLAVLLPALGVSVRRLHDTNRSGWWLLLVFVPLIGGLILLIFSILEGNKGDNRFGPDPKALPQP